MLDQLREIDPAVLLNVVRQDQRSPDFEITDWTVGVLSTKGASSPDGLFFFSGNGQDSQGIRPWSVALKILKDPGGPEVSIDNWWNWRRELRVSQSGFLAQLPEPLHAPRCYGTIEKEGSDWIWMERIIESTAAHWELDQYEFAARQLGHFNGVYATGRATASDFPWLAKDATRTWITTWSPTTGWDNPYVQRHISAQMRDRIMHLWDDRERFLSTLDRLPQILTHGDTQRRNLIIRKGVDGQDEMVAVDWERLGTNSLGGDLAALVGFSTLIYEWEPVDLQALENATFNAYLAGLQHAGWHGDPRQVRLGYTAFIALWMGVVMPPAIAYFTREDVYAEALQKTGRHSDELASGWVMLGEFALDRADEARQLMAELKL